MWLARTRGVEVLDVLSCSRSSRKKVAARSQRRLHPPPREMILSSMNLLVCCGGYCCGRASFGHGAIRFTEQRHTHAPHNTTTVHHPPPKHQLAGQHQRLTLIVPSFVTTILDRRCGTEVSEAKCRNLSAVAVFQHEMFHGTWYPNTTAKEAFIKRMHICIFC